MSSAQLMTSYYTKDNIFLEKEKSREYLLPKGDTLAEFLIFRSGPCMYGVSILL